jgi:hypothetical protein
MTHQLDTPLVTVLVDTYNHARFIEQAIRSVLSQDFDMSRVEIVVVDDGSTDGTPGILAAFGDQIRVIRKANGGQASAFNCGIAESRGQYIAMLDGDDWWHPHKLTKVVGYMEKHCDVGFVGHGIVITNGEGVEQVLAPGQEVSFRLDSIEGGELLVAHRCYMGTSRMAGRAEVFRRLLPVPEALIVEADEYFFTLAAAICRTVILPDTLCYYRLHSGNLYQYAGYDPKKLKLKSEVHTCLASTIPLMLLELDVPSYAQTAVLGPIRTEARRLYLAAFGGPPGSAFAIEWQIFKTESGNRSLASLVVKFLMLAMVAVLPAGWFYRLRGHWCSLRKVAQA